MILKSLQQNIKVYIKDHNIGLALKIIKYQPYGKLLLSQMLIHCQLDLPINFITRLIVFANWEDNSNSLFFVTTINSQRLFFML